MNVAGDCVVCVALDRLVYPSAALLTLASSVFGLLQRVCVCVSLRIASSLVLTHLDFASRSLLLMKRNLTVLQLREPHLDVFPPHCGCVCVF